MSKLNQMNQYLSSLAVFNTKLHNLHWNVVGLEFKAVHDFTEVLYDAAFGDFDDVAERLKILGLSPYVKLSEYLENSAIKEVDSRDFKPREVLEIVQADLEIFKNLATQIRNTADEENDFVTVAQFEGYIESFDKNLWFLSAMLK